MPKPSSQGALALYRKYRPAGFSELVGQDAVVTGLEAAVETGRVAHAYLFAGPRGTGKTSAARIFAKCLCCLVNGVGPNPCGICEACTSIAAGTAFDVIEIDAASNRGVNEIRELRERVKFAPSQFRYKVYIIDEVHMLTTEAFNALLKTLEEPPEWVVFVLATTEPHRVPATILSRCQRYEFRRVQPADIAKRIAAVAASEKIAVKPEAISRIAYLADGALRDALVLLEQARGFSDGRPIDQAVLDEAFGSTHREVVEAIADAIADADAGAGLRVVAKAVQDGVDPAWLIKECLRWFRLALVALVTPDLLAEEAPPDEAAAIAARSARLGRAKILTALRHLSEASSQTRYSTQPRIDLELTLARIILPGDELSLRAFSDRLRALEERAGGNTGPAPAAPATPSNGAHAESPARKPAKAAPKRSAADPGIEAAHLSAARLTGLWPMVLSAAKERSMQAFAHLQHASVTDADDRLVTIAVDDKFNRDRLAEEKMVELVTEAIHAASGVRPAVRFELAPAPVRRAAAARAGGLALAADVLGDDLL
ncbi:MAG TPA: DNA polymerase III subunit gamma/tau [Candidatus Eremiobacteraceae bacterium]|nr:DNA polymerase III subunit gamma/tau [Candidatus Eremiobacteraceae bacterium]